MINCFHSNQIYLPYFFFLFLSIALLALIVYNKFRGRIDLLALFEIFQNSKHYVFCNFVNFVISQFSFFKNWKKHNLNLNLHINIPKKELGLSFIIWRISVLVKTSKIESRCKHALFFPFFKLKLIKLPFHRNNIKSMQIECIILHMIKPR